MFEREPLSMLPVDIQRDWNARLQPATPTAKGVFRLVAARRTQPKSFEEQRIIVLVVDENGLPVPGARVAFSFSTAGPYSLSDDFLWAPPPPLRAFVASTEGSGQIEQIQGSIIKQGEPGGVTVYLLEPEYSSDVVTGAGMLADHSGLHLTFQLLREGVTPLVRRLRLMEERLAAVEARLSQLQGPA